MNPGRYFLVLTNDMDSFLSCRVITRATGVPIGGFFNFNQYYETGYAEGREPVYVDCAIARSGVRGFDNHRRLSIKDDNVINPNRILPGDAQYFQKYGGSTLLLTAALYDIPIETQAQRDALLCVDSFYTGYYNGAGAWRDITVRWLERLGMKDELLSTLESHDEKYFKDQIKRMELDRHIRIKNGLLEGCEELPSYRFKLKAIGKYQTGKIPSGVRGLFTAAEVAQGNFRFTIMEGVQ